MMQNTTQLVKRERLANGMTLTFFDCSRRVAADRWFVRLRAELAVGLPDTVWQGRQEDDPELLASIRDRLGSTVSMTLERERTFIDAEERDAVLAELVAQVEDNLGSYLNDPAFPERLFARQYDETRQQCLLDRQCGRTPEEEDDDEGPADFSFCFRD